MTTRLPRAPRRVQPAWMPAQQSAEHLAARRAEIQRSERIIDRIAIACLFMIGVLTGFLIGCMMP